MCVVLASAAMPDRATAEPHVRSGYFVGFTLGSTNTSWDWPGGGSQSQWSGSGALRAGIALQNDLLLGVEGWAWAEDDDVQTSGGAVPIEVRLVAVTLAATYFPGDAGFFLRGGVGVANGSLDTSPPAGVDFPIEDRDSGTGVAAAAAMGYEVRVTSRFALGGEAGFTYLGIGTDAVDHVWAYGVGVSLNWYW